jgi:hypothetical protein
MIGRAFAAGRPVAPLPRRGTDAGGAPLDRDESDGSELAGLPVKSLTIPNTVAPPAFRCYRRRLGAYVESLATLMPGPSIPARWDRSLGSRLFV